MAELTYYPENKLDKEGMKNAGSNEDSFLNKLHREADLLGGGLSSGLVHRMMQSREDPLLTGLEIVGSAGAAAGLAILKAAGGRYAMASTAGAALFGLGLAGDVFRRVAPTSGAVVDAWNHPANYDHDKAVVAQYAGSAIWDYGLMAGYGAIGSLAGARIGSSYFGRPLEIASPPVPSYEGDQTLGIGGTSYVAPDVLAALKNASGRQMTGSLAGDGIAAGKSTPDIVRGTPDFISPEDGYTVKFSDDSFRMAGTGAAAPVHAALLASGLSRATLTDLLTNSPKFDPVMGFSAADWAGLEHSAPLEKLPVFKPVTTAENSNFITIIPFLPTGQTATDKLK